MHSIAWWPSVLVLAVATITDICERRIPNWLVLPFLVLGIAVSGAVYGWKGAEQSLLGIGLAALSISPLCWLGGMGIGDLKLCAAIGAWIGPGQLMSALVMAAIAGGFIAFFWALCTASLENSLNGAADLVFGSWRRRFRPHETLTLSNPAARSIPYAPAIAVGTVLSFFSRGL